MCSSLLFPLYSNDHKNCTIKTCLQEGFKFKMSFLKKNFICKEKSGTLTKFKFKKKHNQLYFGILVLASYCYCGDNA